MQMNPKTQLVLIGVSGLFAILFDLVDFSIGFYCTKPLTTLLILTLPLRFPHDQLKAYKKTVLLGLLLGALRVGFHDILPESAQH